MTNKMHKFEDNKTAISIIDRNSLEGIVCDESELEDALRELNPDAPEEVNEAIEQLVYDWNRNECVADLMTYLGIEIRNVDKDAYTYECVGHYNDETYGSVLNRVAALWGFEPSDIVNVDWFECHSILVGDDLVTTPTAVDYEVLQDGRYVSYSTDFTHNHFTTIL